MLLILLACASPQPDSQAPVDSPADTSDSTPEPDSVTVTALVTLDGVGVEGARIYQGGQPWSVLTDGDGQAQVAVDLTVRGEVALTASHPEARTRWANIKAEHQGQIVTIELERFLTGDNPDYHFSDPGAPDIQDTTAQCSHCHKTMIQDFSQSAHAAAASNPWVQDLYAGVARLSEPECAEADGTWRGGLEPGTREPIERCYLGPGTLPLLNPDCQETGCDDAATAFGQCADCHAPGMDVATLGGQDLLQATGIAHDSGVFCDVCHKVESTDMHSSEPGVAGRLRILRPSEVGGVGGVDFQPLMFGPFADVPSPVMGAVPREHFQDGSLCGGCHEHWQPALVPGTQLDARWPDGLPVHTTYSEWQQGPLADAVSCQSCHMPPDTRVGNAADLYNVLDLEPGVVPGWERPAGQVRRHQWVGPRTPDGQMLELAAALDLSMARAQGEEEQSEGDQEWIVQATVSNVGPAHFIPTGEPMRQLIVLVQATCEGVPLAAVGGAALPSWAGALDQQDAGDWSLWPGAEVGQVIRVVRVGEALDYDGWGPFARGDGGSTDGSFSDGGFSDKGLKQETVVGASTITSVDDGQVTLDQPLPAGDRAYRVPSATWPATSQDTAGAWAGASGWSYQRVLVDAQGQPMVPHYAAVDLLADNRIGPGASATSSHHFAACAENPAVQAVLLHRGAPWELAQQKRWPLQDSIMAEGSL